MAVWTTRVDGWPFRLPGPMDVRLIMAVLPSEPMDLAPLSGRFDHEVLIKEAVGWLFKSRPVSPESP